jgi:hypothetical protein
MEPRPLPPERSWPFLAIRRGIPLGFAAVGLLVALLHAESRGWLLLFVVACLAEVGPTFKRGDAYLKNRRTMVRWDGYWVAAFRPVARMLGKEDVWILSFCAWNNHRVRTAFEARPARKALVLLPHCIQMARCKAEVLDELKNCHECGLCPVGDYLESSLLEHWNSRITNRSHKAYREAREFRPDLIVAVSCADRLLKGLVKLPEVPVYAIPLQLPHGMCVDTSFSVPHLKAAMEALVEPRRDPETKVTPLRHEETA